MWATTEEAYTEAVCFAQTCESELFRELEITKLEFQTKLLGKNIEDKVFVGLVEAIAHARVWARFKNGDDRNRRLTPSPQPTPQGGSARKILERA